MPSNFYVVEATNLFCGEHDPTNSKHLTLREWAIPKLEEKFVDHSPGGGVADIEVGGLGIMKLTSAFKLAGFDPDLLAQFGLATPHRRLYTGYGALRDKRRGRSIEVKVIAEARLGKAEAEAFKRGELAGFDYSLNEILHYEVFFDGREKLYYDFFNNEWRVDGISQTNEVNRILRIT